MSLLHYEKSFFFSSDATNGALNKSPDGSAFTVQLNSPISIPEKAIYCTLEVQSATIWNVSPNISIAIGNNKLYIHANSLNYVITIPDGLYSVSDLETRIQREVVLLGLPSNLLTISADDSIQKVLLTFSLANSWIDFTPVDSFRTVLGFDSRLVPTTGQAAGYSEEGDINASFNRVNSYLLKSDFVSNGISVNAISDSVIASVLINVKPGSQIEYYPFNPPKADANELIGKAKSNFIFRLTDDAGRPAEMLGEVYSFTIILRYVVSI